MSFTSEPGLREPHRRSRPRQAAAPRALVRVRTALPPADPWAFRALAARPGEPVVAWAGGTGGDTILAVGEAVAVRMDGPDRLAEARRFCSDVREHLVDGASPEAPLLFAGLAFVAGGERQGGPWRGWPGGILRVPRLLIRRTEAGTEVLSTAVVGATEPVTAAAARLAREAAALTPVGPGPTSEPADPRERDEPEARRAWLLRAESLVDRLRAPGAELTKVVLARGARFDAPPARRFDPWRVAEALRSRHPGVTVFAVTGPEGSAFVGATPELLVRTRGERVETVALAGTARREGDPRIDAEVARALLARAKDRHEHRLVVDAIAGVLAPLADGIEVAAAPRVRSLPDVHHLETPVRARLRQGGLLWDLVEGLHPTPAVGGWPREAALRELARAEGLDRGWYAAPLGWLDAAGDGELHVALRSALVTPRTAWAFAGAGLVAASNPAAEWDETVDKLEAVRRALVSVPAEGSP